MEDTLQHICNALDDLSASILQSNADSRNMIEYFGYTYPALNSQDFAKMASNLSQRIKDSNFNNIDKNLSKNLILIPNKILLFKTNALPYFWSQSANPVISGYFNLMDYINISIEPLFSWQNLQDNKALPPQLAKRLRSIQSELDGFVPDKELLHTQIQTIEDAFEAAESLPTDLENLKEAKKKVDKFSSDATLLYGKIDEYYKEIKETSKIILEKKTEAEELIAKSEEAYRTTTTKGLAAAFDQRATKLGNTMWAWVGGLLTSLIVGGIIGNNRFEALTATLSSADPKWGVILMQFILSIIGLAAPIWFAWLATKQINQRFKLAEDYSFKASVAKAYEGYRREAIRIDEKLETRLFSSALTRLEEAPLRLIDNDTHGSPWSEILNIRSQKSKENTEKEKLPEVKSVAKPTDEQQ